MSILERPIWFRIDDYDAGGAARVSEVPQPDGPLRLHTDGGNEARRITKVLPHLLRRIEEPFGPGTLVGPMLGHGSHGPDAAYVLVGPTPKVILVEAKRGTINDEAVDQLDWYLRSRPTRTEGLVASLLDLGLSLDDKVLASVERLCGRGADTRLVDMAGLLVGTRIDKKLARDRRLRMWIACLLWIDDGRAPHGYLRLGPRPDGSTAKDLRRADVLGAHLRSIRSKLPASDPWRVRESALEWRSFGTRGSTKDAQLNIRYDAPTAFWNWGQPSITVTFEATHADELEEWAHQAVQVLHGLGPGPVTTRYAVRGTRTGPLPFAGSVRAVQRAAPRHDVAVAAKNLLAVASEIRSRMSSFTFDAPGTGRGGRP